MIARQGFVCGILGAVFLLQAGCTAEFLWDPDFSPADPDMSAVQDLSGADLTGVDPSQSADLASDQAPGPAPLDDFVELKGAWQKDGMGCISDGENPKDWPSNNKLFMNGTTVTSKTDITNFKFAEQNANAACTVVYEPSITSIDSRYGAGTLLVMFDEKHSGGNDCRSNRAAFIGNNNNFYDGNQSEQASSSDAFYQRVNSFLSLNKIAIDDRDRFLMGPKIMFKISKSGCQWRIANIKVLLLKVALPETWLSKN